MFIFRFFYNLFHNVYVNLFAWYTFFLIKKATKAAAKLMVMTGKDPNYVPPPPPPPAPPAEPVRKSTNIQLVYDGYYVNHPAAHPILKARAQWEEKLAKATAKVMAAKAATASLVNDEPVITPPTIKEVLAEEDKSRLQNIASEIGSDAISSMNKAISAIEKHAIEEKKKAE